MYYIRYTRRKNKKPNKEINQKINCFLGEECGLYDNKLTPFSFNIYIF